MALDYRCYFFGPTTMSLFGVRRSIEDVEDVHAESDEQACMRAESTYRRRHNQMHGFELWQGARLVHREAATPVEAKAAPQQKPPNKGRQSHEE